MLNRSRHAVNTGIMILAGLSMAGCTALSKEGPTSANIKEAALVSVASDTSKSIFDYVLIDVDNATVAKFGKLPQGSLFGTFGNVRGAAPQLRLGIGDVVQVTIFEAQSGGLFLPQEAGSRPGNYVTLPAQQIDGRGDLNIPYAGTVRFAERSITDVQNEIASKLSNRAIEPQVLITLANQRSSQVSVIGDVRAPSRIDVNPAGDRIIDVIARAGGPVSPGYETYVSLQRGGRKSTVFFDDILSQNRENIYVHPDDTIYLYREAESFLAFGATNSTNIRGSSKVEFGSHRLTLAEGLAKVGGVSDTRADAKKIFIYRTIDRPILANAQIDLTRFAPTQKSIPVIFQIDLRNPSAYFAAQNFELANKDIIYVDNSGAYELSKFLSLVSGTASTVTSVANSVTATKNANDLVGR